MTDHVRGPALRSAAELTDAEVWEAFRTLPLDGRDLYDALEAHLRGTAFFNSAGDTLDVGAGDGYLWRRAGSSLLREATARGRLLLTDTDVQALDRARTALDDGNIVVELADACALPYASAAFARLLAVHVLHWCGSPADIRRGVAELARVARPGASVVVVTVDETVHLREVYGLMREAKARLAARGIDLDVELPTVPPRILRFCASNAEDFLTEAFPRVTRIDIDYAHLVESAHPKLGVAGADFVVRYLRSSPSLVPTEQTAIALEVFFEEARAIVAEAISKTGAFRMSRRDVLYACTAAG